MLLNLNKVSLPWIVRDFLSSIATRGCRSIRLHFHNVIDSTLPNYTPQMKSKHTWETDSTSIKHLFLLSWVGRIGAPRLGANLAWLTLTFRRWLANALVAGQQITVYIDVNDM